MSNLPAEQSDFGPAMGALNDRQRAFVGFLVECGGRARDAAMRAGYLKTSENALSVQAHRLMHDPKVIAAIQEEAQLRAQSGGLIAMATLYDLATACPEPAVKLKAAVELANRSGMIVAQRLEVTHRDDKTTNEILKRVQALAERYSPKLLEVLKQDIIDVEATDVEPESADGLEDLL